jgi:predicted Zn-dependent protease
MRIRSGPGRAFAMGLALLEGLVFPATGVLAEGVAGAAWSPRIFAEAPVAPPFRIDKDDFDLGLEVALAVTQEIGLVEDDSLLTRVNDIGARIALAADDASTVLTFYVVPIDAPNAFAVPGGFVFITQGLMDTELSDDAVAHLLGHEVTHVRNRHSARMGTWSAITSLIQTAVMVGLAVGASRAGGTATRTVDEFGAERVSLTGPQAALEGTAVFGSVFRELFLRGFSRKLETEADEVGYRLATRAGYAPAGGAELLETLHRRIYEDANYGYWRTHPYFTDRATAARARTGARGTPPDSAAVARFRLRAQSTLVREARRQEGAAANLLYRAAVRSGPGRGAEAKVELEVARFNLEREAQKPVVARRLLPIAVTADSALARLDRSGQSDSTVAALRAERERVSSALAENLPAVLAVLDAPGAASNATLEMFLENYPDHPRADPVRLALARRYLRQDRANAAVPLLSVLAHAAAVDSLHETGHTELLRAIDAVTDPSVCYAVVDSPPDTAIAGHARGRMQALVADLDSLEVGGRFLKRWPDTPYSEQVATRVAALATDTARFARVYEAGGKPQEALDLYNRVVLLAPGTAAAAEAMRGIERIQGIRES